MRTRITQEEAYDFLKTLPEELTLQEFKRYDALSLHLRLTPKGLKFKFSDEALQETYHIERFKLSIFYKGQEVKKRVPLKMGSMVLWTTIHQYMTHLKPESRENQELPFNINDLRYIGTVDESEGVSSISSTIQLPYRLTHEFLNGCDEDLLFVEDVYPGKEPVYTVIYKDKVWEINYSEEDKLKRLASWGQSIESELSKILKDEQEEYYLYN